MTVVTSGQKTVVGRSGHSSSWAQTDGLQSPRLWPGVLLSNVHRLEQVRHSSHHKYIEHGGTVSVYKDLYVNLYVAILMHLTR